MLNKNSLTFAFFAVVALAFFHNMLDGERIFTERDLAPFFIPPRELWMAAVQGGEFPLWNPYSYSGHPLFATLQPAVLYPPNLLFLLLPFDIAFNWVIIGHFILAASFTFLLVREAGGSRSAAIVGALVFMLGGYLISVHNVLSTLLSVTWAPLAILLFMRSLARRRFERGLYMAGTTVVLTVMFFAGGIETLFGTFIVLLCITTAPATFHVAIAETPLKARVAVLCAVTATFLLIGAVQLLPFLELASLSTRSGGMDFKEATTWSFEVKDFIQFILPDPFGYQTSLDKYWSNPSWIKTVYFGAAPFILTSFYFLIERRRALPMLALMTLSIVLALGGSTPVYRLVFDWLPVFDKVRYPVKFIFIFIVCISFTTALGLDAVVKGIKDKRPEVLTAARVLFILATISALLFGAMNLYADELIAILSAMGVDHPYFNKAAINVYNTKRLLFFFTVTSFIIYLSVRKGLFARSFPALLISVIFVDLFFAHLGYYTTTKAAEYHDGGPVIGVLKKDDDLFRVFVTPMTIAEDLFVSPVAEGKTASLSQEKYKLRGYNMSHRVFTTGGFHVMKRGDYDGLMEEAVNRRSSIDATNLLAMLNVRYVLSLPEIESDEFVLKEAFGSAVSKGPGDAPAELKLYENMNYLPRFYTVANYRVMEKDDMALYMSGKGFDPASEVLLLEEPDYVSRPDVAQSSYAGTPGRVEVMDYKMNSITLAVEMERTGILVASESWYPGWRVYVDGEMASLMKANYIQRAVVVGEGTHVVRFVYSPASFKAGAAISVFTVLTIAVLLAFLYRKEKAHGSAD